MISVYGICNPLLDFIAHEDHGLVESMNTRPGTMNLIDREGMERLLQRIRGYRNTPGGSGANTIRGIAWLNRGGELLPPLFCGAVGRDAFGDRYVELMGSMGVRTCMNRKESPSGRSVIIVTPDRERTMFTYLGACREFTEADVDFDLLRGSCLLHVTGYMWDTDSQKGAVRAAVEAARAARIMVSLDLADPFVVERNRDDFLSWIPGRVDLLFGNREELSLLVGSSPPACGGGADGGDEEILRRGAELARTVVLKVGRDGCLVLKDGEVVRSPGYPVEAVDSTGAGDSFASGFLYGLLRGRDLARCARLANRLASCIVSIEGCNYDQLVREAALDGA